MDERKVRPSSPTEAADAAMALERTAKFADAAKMWREAAGLTLGAGRAGRYREAAERCERMAGR